MSSSTTATLLTVGAHSTWEVGVGTRCDSTSVSCVAGAYLKAQVLDIKEEIAQETCCAVCALGGEFVSGKLIRRCRPCQEQDVTDSSNAEVSLTLDHLSTVAYPSEQWVFEFFDDEVTRKRCGILYTRRLVQA